MVYGPYTIYRGIYGKMEWYYVAVRPMGPGGVGKYTDRSRYITRKYNYTLIQIMLYITYTPSKYKELHHSLHTRNVPS